MYDAANPDGIPRDAKMVGLYVDGLYRASQAQWNMFPNAVKVRIAVLPGTNDGHVFDGPPDNATWPQVVGWVAMRRRAGADPSVYTDLDQWPVAQGFFRQAGVAEPHWWIANWNGVTNVPPGMVAHQYANVGTAYDLSAVLDYWPGVDPAPAPPGPHPPPPVPMPPPIMPPPPLVPPEDKVFLNYVGNAPDGTSPGIWLLSGSVYAHVPDPADVQNLQSAGVQHAPITYQMHQALLAAAAALHGTIGGSLGVQGNLTVS
jgi:hypothetical protein